MPLRGTPPPSSRLGGRHENLPGSEMQSPSSLPVLQGLQGLQGLMDAWHAAGRPDQPRDDAYSLADKPAVVTTRLVVRRKPPHSAYTLPHLGDVLMGFVLGGTEAADVGVTVGDVTFPSARMRPGEFRYAIDGVWPVPFVALAFHETFINVPAVPVTAVFVALSCEERRLLSQGGACFDRDDGSKAVVISGMMHLLPAAERATRLPRLRAPPAPPAPPPAPAAAPPPVYLVVSHDYGKGGRGVEAVGLRAATGDLAAARSAMQACTIWAAGRCVTFELLECSSELTGAESLALGPSFELSPKRASAEGLRVLQVTTCLSGWNPESNARATRPETDADVHNFA